MNNQNPIPKYTDFSQTHFEKENINCLFKFVYSCGITGKDFMLCLKTYKVY